LGRRWEGFEGFDRCREGFDRRPGGSEDFARRPANFDRHWEGFEGFDRRSGDYESFAHRLADFDRRREGLEGLDHRREGLGGFARRSLIHRRGDSEGLARHLEDFDDSADCLADSGNLAHRPEDFGDSVRQGFEGFVRHLGDFPRRLESRLKGFGGLVHHRGDFAHHLEDFAGWVGRLEDFGNCRVGFEDHFGPPARFEEPNRGDGLATIRAVRHASFEFQHPLRGVEEQMQQLPPR